MRWKLAMGLFLIGYLGPLDGGLQAKEGFGINKLAVQLSRVRPPEVLITDTRIAVRSSGQGQGGSFESQLIAALESELIGNDPRLRLEPDHPETLIEIALLDHSIEDRWETRTASRKVRTGTDSKGKPIFSNRLVKVRYQLITQVANVALKVSSLKQDRTLLADTVLWSYDEELKEGHNAPAHSQLESMARAWLAQRIARRLTPTHEQVGVLVPKGSFKELGNLAKSGLWGRYLEALEGRPPFPAARDEAYRQYALGLAYEALGYESEEPSITINYLEQAALHYNSAIAQNPQEKFFTKAYEGTGIKDEFEASLVRVFGGDPTRSAPRKRAMAPLERVQTALEQYQQTVDFAQQLEAGFEAAVGAKDLAGEPQGGEGEAVVDNAAIIDMVRAGLDDEIILTTLESAPATRFDTTPQGLIQLAKGQVSSQIIARIQALASPDEP